MAKPYEYVQEYEFHTVLAAMISAKLNSTKVVNKVFFRDMMGIIRAYNEAAKWKPDIMVELHFNAASSKRASGFETLHGPSEDSRILAEKIHEWIGSAMPDLRRRRVKKLTNGDRGWANVSALQVPTVIVEPFFGSNVDDCEQVLSQMPELAHGIVDGILSYFVPQIIRPEEFRQ
jgi:N-acetylmuramoyl-L-alanine amidase